MAIPDMTFALFGLFNMLRLVSYLPQIVRVARDPHGAGAISYTCWVIWIGANASTAAYAAINLDDLWLSAVSSFNAACCIVVVGLTVWKRNRWYRLQRNAPFVDGTSEETSNG
jgi:hypothetical protein